MLQTEVLGFVYSLQEKLRNSCSLTNLRHI